ncbi:hypothetical protein FRIGORI9N_100019 [Frigoribacterium sp. 9N]|nr:hypothetical protein FRIGORI9N_100019 [Frigoribacterium sp. 9N]
MLAGDALNRWFQRNSGQIGSPFRPTQSTLLKPSLLLLLASPNCGLVNANSAGMRITRSSNSALPFCTRNSYARERNRPTNGSHVILRYSKIFSGRLLLVPWKRFSCRPGPNGFATSPLRLKTAKFRYGCIGIAANDSNQSRFSARPPWTS